MACIFFLFISKNQACVLIHALTSGITSTAGEDCRQSSGSLRVNTEQIIFHMYLSKSIRVGTLSSELTKFTANHEMPCKSIQRFLLLAFELLGLPFNHTLSLHTLEEKQTFLLKES